MKNFNIPWLNARKIVFVRIAIDLISFSIFYTNKAENLFELIFLMNITFLWILISYIIGRYPYNFNINLLSIIKFVSLTLMTISLLLPTLFVQDYFFQNYLVNDIKYNFLKLLPYLFLMSTLAQIICSVKLNTKKDKKTISIFFGSEKNYKIINKLKNKYQPKSIIEFGTKTLSNKNLIQKYDTLIIDSYESFSPKKLDQILYFMKKGKNIISMIDWSEINLQRLPIELINKSDFLINKLSNQSYTLQLRIKRICDLLFGIILIICALPILLIIGISIKLEDGGPIFYKQIRSGIDEINFELIKLRTMVVDSEKSGPQWSNKNDPRITKVGRIIRKLRIDELPQIISVIKGDMSLIGPRPERPVFEKEIKKKIKFYNIRHLVKPGLSGWAQVNYPYGASIKDTKYKLTYDLYYLKNFSIWLDLLIFFKTIKLVTNAKGSTPDY